MCSTEYYSANCVVISRAAHAPLTSLDHLVETKHFFVGNFLENRSCRKQIRGISRNFQVIAMQRLRWS